MAVTPEPIDEPYFQRQDASVVVGRALAAGPWSTDQLAGRAVVALVAWGAERDHGGTEWQPARLTVDMFRPAPMAPLTVTSTRIRDGSRVRACDVFIHHGDRLVCRGSAVFVRRGEDPPGTVWSPPGWEGPYPADLSDLLGDAGLGDLRLVTPFGAPAQGLAWIHETHDLVDGEPSTPFVRTAGVTDWVNPLSNSGDRGLAYINADLTLYLARLPRGEWVGLRTFVHAAAQGVAVGGAAVYDTEGMIGSVQVCAVADTRMQEQRRGTPPQD
jgi:hypothetical protein